MGQLSPENDWAASIMEEENGEEVAYYLGKHIKEARKIFAMKPSARDREIGKLSAKIASQTVAPQKPSKAPPPIAPVSATSAVNDGELQPQMKFEDYRKIGNKMFRGRS